MGSVIGADEHRTRGLELDAGRAVTVDAGCRAVLAGADPRAAEIGPRWVRPRPDPLLSGVAHAIPVGLHGRGDQLLFAKEDPYHSYEMDEYCETSPMQRRLPQHCGCAVSEIGAAQSPVGHFRW
ncbi:hypothetical protein GCM10028790_06660 [Micromonospora taraxaci]